MLAACFCPDLAGIPARQKLLGQGSLVKDPMKEYHNLLTIITYYGNVTIQ